MGGYSYLVSPLASVFMLSQTLASAFKLSQPLVSAFILSHPFASVYIYGPHPSAPPCDECIGCLRVEAQNGPLFEENLFTQ